MGIATKTGIVGTGGAVGGSLLKADSHEKERLWVIDLKIEGVDDLLFGTEEERLW